MKKQLLWIMLFIASMAFSQKVVYVKEDAQGANNGTSWTNAFRNLQDAILSTNTKDNDQVWVAKGLYLVVNGTSIDDKLSINITQENLKLYGGFKGDESTLEERDATLIHTTNRTTLSGDITGDDGQNFANRIDNTNRLLTIRKSATIDGITVSGASGYDLPAVAIYKLNTADRLTINNCIIEDNLATSNGKGIIYLDSNSNDSVTVSNCIIRNNQSASGTFFAQTNTDNITLDINFINNLVHNNTATKFAGSALWFRADKGTINSKIINNTIVDNTDLNSSNNGINITPIGVQQNSVGRGKINTVFSNNIVWNNMDKNGNTYSTGNGAKSIANIYTDVNNTKGTITVNNSIGEDNYSSITNKNNTSNVAPNLTSDYKLQSGSPAIDTGDNSKVPTGITTDLLGNARIYNTTVDMGAYEFGSSRLSSDKIVKKDIISIYPNPVKNNIHIKASKLISRVEVYSMSGVKLMSSKTERVDVNNLSTGVYMVKVIYKDGKVSSHRIIK